MFLVAHALTGAAIASVLPDPRVFTPLAIIAHYAEDHVPHWDFGTGLHSGKRSKNAAMLFGLLDLMAAFALVYLFWQSRSSIFLLNVWLGALAGILPDILDAPHNFFSINLSFLRPLHELHEKIHQSNTNMIEGLLPQFALIGAIAFFALV